MDARHGVGVMGCKSVLTFRDLGEWTHVMEYVPRYLPTS